MNSKEISMMAGCTQQNIQKKTKQAVERGEDILHVKGKSFLFEIVNDGRGKSYEYTFIDDSVMGAEGGHGNIILGGNENVCKDRDRRQQRHEASYGGGRCCDEMWECGDICTDGKGSRVWDEPTKERKERSDGGHVESFGGYREDGVDENTSGQFKKDSGATARDKDSDEKSQETRDGSGFVSEVSVGWGLGRGDEDSSTGANARKAKFTIDEKKEVVAYAKLHGATASSKFFNVPINTVYRWIKGFSEKGSKGLADKRGGVVRADLEKIRLAIYAGGSMCATSWWKMYCRFWAEDNGEVFDIVNPTADISRATFLRHASRLKQEDKSVREFLGKGLDGLSVRPTAIRDYLARNEEWQIDATSVDFMALDDEGNPKRYTAIAMIDVGTSRRVWELADSPNSYANVRLLKKALLKMGRPERIKGDNGKDYVGGHFQGALDRLGISYIKAQPFRGDQKGKVERGFGVEQRELELLPGFLGHNVGQRSQRENQAVHKSERLSGAKTNIKNLLTKGELQAYIDDLFEKKYFANEEKVTCEFDLRVLGKSVERQLHATGFSINGVYYLSLEVFRYAEIGERLEVIEDIDDLSVYHVYRDGEYLTDVYNNEVVNYTAEEWKAVQKEYTATHVKAKKALVKLAQNTKDELLKSDAMKLEQKRKEAQRKERKELAYASTTLSDPSEKESFEVLKVTKNNKTTYRPKLDEIKEYFA